MSSTNKTANYELSQFVGTDIPSILSDYNGDMRKIDAGIAEVATSAGSSASAISALAGRVTTAENNIQTLNGALEVTNQRSIQNQTAITAIDGKIPAEASSENQLVTVDDLTEVSDSVKDIDDTLSNIVPSTASIENKLATMADVNSAGGRLFGTYTGTVATALQSFQSDISALDNDILTHNMIIYISSGASSVSVDNGNLYHGNGQFLFPDISASDSQPDKVQVWKSHIVFDDTSQGQHQVPTHGFVYTLSNLKDTYRCEGWTLAGGSVIDCVAETITMRVYVI